MQQSPHKYLVRDNNPTKSGTFISEGYRLKEPLSDDLEYLHYQPSTNPTLNTG